MLNLAHLRPEAPTDLLGLAELLGEGDARNAALPGKLPESFLVSVARDLRSVEDSGDEEAVSHSPLAGPIMLVLSLLQGISQNEESLTIGEDALFEALHYYQWAVEREVIFRLTGVGGANDMKILLERLTEISSRLET